jgi:hypothetical protein
MSRWMYQVIWNLSEWSGIGLGRFAPYVFHQMIGGDKPCREITNSGEK